MVASSAILDRPLGFNGWSWSSFSSWRLIRAWSLNRGLIHKNIVGYHSILLVLTCGCLYICPCHSLLFWLLYLLIGVNDQLSLYFQSLHLRCTLLSILLCEAVLLVSGLFVLLNGIEVVISSRDGLLVYNIYPALLNILLLDNHCWLCGSLINMNAFHFQMLHTLLLCILRVLAIVSILFASVLRRILSLILI